MSGIVRGVGILVGGMAAGASLAWATGLPAAHTIDLGTYLDVYRDTYGSRAFLSIVLDGTAMLLAIATAVGLRDKRRILPPAALASIGLVAAIVLGVLLIEPMSAEMAGWTGATAPDDASVHIRLLTRLLVGRAALEGLAAVGMLFAIVADRPVRRSYSSIVPETDEEATHMVLVPGR